MVGLRAHFAPQNKVNTTAPRHPEESGHFRPARVQVLRIPKPRISSGHGAPRCEWFRNGRRCPVSQEQTFLPKLQVYFADFPYSHCSIGLEVLNLGDLLRFPERIRKQSAFTKVIFSLKRDSYPRRRTGPALFHMCFVRRSDSAHVVWGFGSPLLRHGKKKTSPGPIPRLYNLMQGRRRLYTMLLILSAGI